VDLQKLTNYFLARLKEKFSGKIIITFDKGVLVNLERDIREDVATLR